MEAREIKKVSEGEIVEKTMQMGDERSANFQIDMLNEGNYTFSGENPADEKAGFISFTEIEAFDGKRFQVFDAYAYNAENGITSEPGVQILEGDTIILYTKPAYYDEQVKGIYFIEFKRKTVVLSIDK